MTDLERGRRIARQFRRALWEPEEKQLAGDIATGLAAVREEERQRVLGLLEEWREAMVSVGQVHSLEYMLNEVRGGNLVVHQFEISRTVL